MEKRQRSIIRRHWENYLGTSMNTLYNGEEFQAVASDNLERPPYNQVTPKDSEADLSSLEQLKTSSVPVLHGEKEFIENFRDERFPDTELKREDCWMKFTGEKPEKQSFKQADFTWIDEKDTADYLEVLQKVFGPSDFYINLHRKPVKEYGKEVFRIVVYKDERPVSIGEMRFNGGDAFIYSLATLESEQGEGLATEVLRQLLIKAGELGAEEVFLMAEASEWLVDFYRDRGFEVDFSVFCYSGGSWDGLF